MERVYVFSSGRLRRKDNTLYFESEKGKRFIPVEDVKEIYLFGEADLNTKVLSLLSQKGIVLHLFNRYGFYSGSFLPRKRNVSGHLLVKQVKHYLDGDSRLFLAASFIDGAVFHIKRNLRRRGIETREIEELESQIFTVETIAKLMQLEGKIREIYYSKFSKILKEEFFSFSKRVRRPPNNAVNALISYGNSLLYSVVLSELYRTQLDPTVSYLHEPSTSRYSLSLDISEIFKPLVVDSLIFSLINKKVLRRKDFDSTLNYTLLSESGRKKFVKAFDEKMKTTVRHRTLKRNVSYRYLIRLECYKLIKHLINDKVYKPLKAWW
ncbi:type I-B CRISPR-associated endonuclease Cas1b [Thermovibrio sp.]